MLDAAVIADDVTGAADCSVAFALAGIDTYVTLERLCAAPAARAVAVDADSRRLGARAAAERASAEARAACERGALALYKKIDSTLRGHAGPEIRAVCAAVAEANGGNRPLALVSPAFPRMGRAVRRGRVLVDGAPLPIDLIALLRQAGLSAASVDLDTVRGPLARTLARLAREGTDAALCDAEDDRDLELLARGGAELDAAVVWAGSGGLARFLPQALGLRGGENARPIGPAEGPILIAVGTRSDVSRAQVERLASDPAVELFAPEPRELLADAGRARLASRLQDALARGRDVVLTVGDGPDSGDPVALATALGRLAACDAPRLSGLVATGGDTARASLLALGARGLRLAGEVEPGVPIGIADAPRPFPVVTKAGAFGTAETLLRCRDVLRRGRSG